jgi:hypothetical protein
MTVKYADEKILSLDVHNHQMKSNEEEGQINEVEKH